MTQQVATAKVIEDLVDYDGPQLLLLKTNRNRHMIAAAVRAADMDEPFFGCEVTDKTYDNYFDDRVDLHFVFRRAIGRFYYLFDLSKSEHDTVKLIKMKSDEAENPSFWPQVGFFARSHTTKFNRITAVSALKSYKIDGKWGANDFSHFHAKMSDLYALFGVLDRLDGQNSQTEMGFIKKTIQERFWQGGGSYVGFYDSLLTRNRLLNLAPLEVARIQYASPGEISLRGNKSALSEISDIISVFDTKWDRLMWSYRNIRSVLRKEKLLRARPTAHFSSASTREFVKKATREFADEMQLERVEEIFAACDHNVLVFAKVILSIFRRGNELYKFHAEGRVQRLD
jgi:hypothetical protein